MPHPSKSLEIEHTDTLFSEDQEKRAALVKMKLVATGLLCAMVVLFIFVIVFEQDYQWLSWVRAFTEAAMVGALADWFAVTALFRHPLGIPIPHTAIIPLNKKRVARTMGNFIQNNFLSEEVVERKIIDIDIAGAVANWCSKQDSAERLSKELVSAFPEILKSLDDFEIQRFINQNILEIIHGTHFSPLAGHILRTFTSGNKHQEIIDLLLPSIEGLVAMHHQYIGRAIKDEMPWYVPGFIHEKVYQSIVARVKNTFEEINANPRHPLRERVQTSVDLFIEKLISSPHYLARGEEIKEWILNNSIIRDYINRVWSEIKTIIIHDIQRENSRIQNTLERGVVNLARGLQKHEKVREQVNQWVHLATKSLVKNHKDEIIALISDTVSHWDTATIINKLELEVGKDLQYIRINGTIVGGLAGLVIYALVVLVQ